MSMSSLAAVALAFLVSASVSSFAMANILIALPYVFMMATTINEMKGQVFTLGNFSVTGEMYMKAQGIDYSPWGFWQNQVALFGIAFVCMVLAYIQLLRINRWK
ncbi:hypothetical protein AAFF_G00271340 [Aldrovandia affinis]|uniref:Uncharacterized protein n=1 Tax=Aldrovandia affinis TaxID=143900 RepID=A0AAD7RAY2_9TELE|nr:hypothetical protein AAFF_G00271340 [Aldrovandia affinis]